MDFYVETIRKLMTSGKLAVGDKVLVVCGGSYDAQALAAAGLKDVVITNLDERYDGYCAPFQWAYDDAESLSVADGSFDWVIEHDGLHHCASPHRAVLEMYRVARKGILAFEARDSALMRLAIRLGFTPDYEVESVVLNGYDRGGVRDTGIPNFIYRWKEREVFKTIESAHPDRLNKIQFFYGLRLPYQRMTMIREPLRTIMRVAAGAAKLVSWIVPSQGNQFAFAIYKSDEVKPWIRLSAEGNAYDPNYKTSFDPAKYVKDYEI